jgi:hypothetical protein
MAMERYIYIAFIAYMIKLYCRSCLGGLRLVAQNFAISSAQHQAVIGDSFFATPSFGVGDKKPFVLQRRPAVEWTEWTDGISAA